MITQEELREKVKYSYKTGEFTSKVKTRKHKIGDVVGCPNAKGYLRFTLNKKPYLLHRLVWLYIYGRFPVGVIDHIDGNPFNNKLENLRECTQVENLMNCKISSNNTSGYKGVSYAAHTNRWKATGKDGNQRIHLGLFNTPEEASKVYNDFASKTHGEFYRDTTI